MSTTTPVQEHYDTSSVFVAVIGRPNVGKSSLTNLLVGEKVAIVTSKPQTTRTRITGVITRGPLQYVLLDTPGVHKAHNKLGKRMDKTASDSIADVDVSMMLFEPYGALNESEMALVEALHRSGRDLHRQCAQQRGQRGAVRCLEPLCRGRPPLL